MFEITSTGGFETTFWVCAIGGTVFFALRIVLVVFTGFGDFGFHADGLGDGGGDALGVDHDMAHDSDVAFQFLSVNSLTAFVMMFGWAGLAAYKQYGFGYFITGLIAVLAGVGMMLITSYLFVLARKLTTQGAGFSLSQAVGENASVYLRIPEGGTGKIQLNLNGILREIEAQSASGESIESFTNVKVLRVLGPSLVQVARADK
jgi:hypothetical protein